MLEILNLRSVLTKALLVGAIFLSGYATAWHYGRENLKAFQYEVMLQGEIQKSLNEQTVKHQDKIIKDNQNEYQKRMAAINAINYGGMQRNSCSGSMSSSTPGQDTSGVISYSSDYLPPTEVLAKQCAITTNQLVTLIDIIKQNQLGN